MTAAGETSTAIIPYTGDTLSRSRQWTDLSEPELRRLAVTACRDQDEETLWSLTEAYFTTYGASGAKASRHTLRAYRQGLGVFLTHAGTRAVNLLHPARDLGPSFLREREAAGKSPGTVRLELAAVNRQGRITEGEAGFKRLRLSLQGLLQYGFSRTIIFDVHVGPGKIDVDVDVLGIQHDRFLQFCDTFREFPFVQKT